MEQLEDPGLMPTLTDLQRIITSYAEAKLLVPKKTAHEQWREEQKLVIRYRQRELHELTQNAVDRAERAVVMCLDRAADRLVVGNDGRPVSIAPPAGPPPASDVEGINSVNTSRKRAYEAIGNKGVGFKSVFGAARTVEVWSRHREAGWWGFRAHHPFTAERIALDPGGEIATYCGGLPRGEAPSFYFPVPLDPTTSPLLAAPWVAAHGLCTLIVLRELRNPADLHERFLAFTEQPLHFVSARYGDENGMRIHFVDGSGASVAPPRGISLPADWDAYPEPGTHPLPGSIRTLAEEANLSFKWSEDANGPAVPPHLRLAFPASEPDLPRGLFWSFLPTEQGCPFPLQLHGDFLLTDDRSRLQARSPYNAAMLREVPPLLHRAFSEVLAGRADRWLFLAPSKTREDPLVDAVREYLFGPEHRLIELAAEAFGTVDRGPNPQPRGAFESFWALAAAWERGLAWERSQARTRQGKLESHLLGPLRERGVCCLPVADHPDPTGLLGGAPLRRGPNLLFRGEPRPGTEDDSHLPVPTWLAARGVQITWFLPPEAVHRRKQLAWTSFVWSQVVHAIRDGLLVEHRRGEAFDPTTAPWKLDASSEHAEELAAFVIASIAESQSRVDEPPAARLALWSRRLEKAERDRSLLLKSYATMPLPVVGGDWLPACRCSTTGSAALGASCDGSWGVVDRDRLPPGPATDDALRQLGVWPSMPMVQTLQGPAFAQAPESLEDAAARDLLAEVSRSRSAYEDAVGQLPGSVLGEAWLWTPSGRTSPLRTWRIRRGDQTDYGTVPRVIEGDHPAATWLLDALGVYALVDRRGDDTPPGTSAKAIATLRRLAEEPVPTDRPDRAPLLRVARRLAGLVAPKEVGADNPVPVLATCRSGGLRWVQLPEPTGRGPRAWRVARRAGRWTYLFRSLWIAAIEPTAPLAGLDAMPLFDPTVEARTEPAGALTLDPTMRGRLERALPELCAVAAARRLGPSRRFDLEAVLARWNAVQVLRGPNVYLSISQRDGGQVLRHAEGLRLGPDGPPILGDVYFTPSPTGAEAAAAVMHDIPAERTALGWCEDDPHRYLDRFADWCSRELFRAGTAEAPSVLEGVLSRKGKVLGSLEGAQAELERHLRDRFGVEPDDVAAMRSRVVAGTIGPAEAASLERDIRRVLGRFGTLKADFVALTAGWDPGIYIQGTLVKATELQVQGALRDALGGRYPAAFSCRSFNQARWRATKAAARDTVLLGEIIRAGVAAWSDDAVVGLHHRWERLGPDDGWLADIDSDPWAVIRAEFPDAADTPPPDTPGARAVLARRPWATPVPASDVGLTGGRRGGSGSSGVQDESTRTARSGRKKERGDNAEVACARLQASALQARLRDSSALRDALDAERRLHGDVRAFDWDLAVSDGDVLARLLRISGPGGRDCGFDVLSLDEAGVVVRIEVKSSQDGRIHLTENEVLRAEEAPERYRLIVYRGLSIALDLSSQLRTLLEDRTLREARERLRGKGGPGFQPEGYVLRLIDRPS